MARLIRCRIYQVAFILTTRFIIFVYYIISDWLYEQLQNIGACVTEYKGLYIWGRCDFGQGLDMNYELKTIAKNIIKED